MNKKNKDIISQMVTALMNAVFIVAVFSFLVKGVSEISGSVEIELLIYFVLFCVSFLYLGKSYKE